MGSPYTDEFVRAREGGTVLDRIQMPGGVACALGGPDRRTLFLLGVAPQLIPPVGGRALPESDAVSPGLSGRIATTQVQAGAAGWR